MGKGITPFIRRDFYKKQKNAEEKKKMKVPILNGRGQLGSIRKPFFERFDKI